MGEFLEYQKVKGGVVDRNAGEVNFNIALFNVSCIENHWARL